MAEFSFVDTDLSEVSLVDGYRRWRTRRGRIASFGGFTCRGRITPGRHWGANDIATGGCGNGGVRVLLPISSAARKLVRQHTTVCWAHEHNVSYAIADLVYGVRASWKHESIATIFAAINDPHCHPAIRDFPGVGPGPGGHLGWEHKWGDVVAPYLGTSWPRTAALIAVVRAVIGE